MAYSSHPTTVLSQNISTVYGEYLPMTPMWGGAPGWFSHEWLRCGGHTKVGWCLAVFTERSGGPRVTLNSCVMRRYDLGEEAWYSHYYGGTTINRTYGRRKKLYIYLCFTDNIWSYLL